MTSESDVCGILLLRYLCIFQIFDAGDVDRFAVLVDENREAYFSQPALANRQEFVKVG